ncbi:unnamed protein product [Rotaria magnacalcarata]
MLLSESNLIHKRLFLFDTLINSKKWHLNTIRVFSLNINKYIVFGSILTCRYLVNQMNNLILPAVVYAKRYDCRQKTHMHIIPFSFDCDRTKRTELISNINRPKSNSGFHRSTFLLNNY